MLELKYVCDQVNILVLNSNRKFVMSVSLGLILKPDSPAYFSTLHLRVQYQS